MRKLHLVIFLIVLSAVFISCFDEDKDGNEHHKLVKRGFWKKFWKKFKSVIISTIIYVLQHPRQFGIYGCPHILNGKEVQTCDIVSEKPLPFFSNDSISIDLAFAKIPGVSTKTDGSLVSSAYLKFNNGRSTVSFSAKDPSQPLKAVFDDGSSEVKDPKTGNLWVGIYELDIDGEDPAESAVFIQDNRSKSTITLYQRKGEKNKWYNLMMYTENETAANAKGLLIEGCPKQWINTEVAKESDTCAKVPGSTEPALSAEVVQRTCNHDNLYDGELAKSMYSFMDVANTLTDVKDILSKPRE